MKGTDMTLNFNEFVALVFAVLGVFFLLPYIGTRIGNSTKYLFFGKDKYQ
jgi:hypothetical protein